MVRQSGSDMDRFLAEIDRLRKKNAEAPTAPRGETVPVAPVVQPAKPVEKPRARVVAELGRAAGEPAFRLGLRPATLAATPLAPAAPGAADRSPRRRPADGDGDSLSGGHRRPATKVTRLMLRPRPAPKTPFAKNLTTLLGTGQGLALAIVLSEVLGTPRSKKT